MRTVCEQSVSKGPRLAVSRAPDDFTSNAPIFKLCSRSSAPLIGVWDLGAIGVAARHRPPRSARVAVAAAVGHSLRAAERPTSPSVPSLKLRGLPRGGV